MKFKSLFTSVIMLLLFTSSIFAADLTLGGYAGITMGWESGEDSRDFIDVLDNGFGKASNESRMGFSLGIFLDIPISESFSIQPELQYTLAKTGYNYTDLNDIILEDLKVETTETFNTLVIPIYAKYKILAGKGKINLFGGPMIFLILGDAEYKAELNYYGDTESVTEDFETDKSAGFGFSIGVGYEIPMGNGKLVTDLRFSKTLTDIMDNYNGRLNILGVNIGYGFNL